MNNLQLRAYLAEVTRQLRARGVFDPRILEEVEAHLAEAVEREQDLGLNPDEAWRQALERFGDGGVIAAGFAAERGRSMQPMQKVLLGAALGLGVLFGYLDSRPSWDDTGVSALAIAVTCALLGALGPQRPWLWALAVGVWVPVFGVGSAHNYGSLMALVLAFIGAYAGMALRNTLVPA